MQADKYVNNSGKKHHNPSGMEIKDVNSEEEHRF